MKKTVKKIITGILITTITLAAGFGITILSFNLFDNLTDNRSICPSRWKISDCGGMIF